jgi:hypothetical protein
MPYFLSNLWVANLDSSDRPAFLDVGVIISLRKANTQEWLGDEETVSRVLMKKSRRFEKKRLHAVLTV